MLQSFAFQGEVPVTRTTVDPSRSSFKDRVHGILSILPTRPGLLLLIFGGLFGVIFIIITPPGYNSDEPNHFYRVAQVAQGEVIGHDVVPGDPPYENGKPVDQIGGEVPSSIVELFRQSGADGFPSSTDINGSARTMDWTSMWELPSRAEHVPVTMVNTEVYSPLVYIPAIIPYLIGQLFNFPILLVFYLARIMNLVVALLLTFAAIRIAPRGKWIFLTIGLLPTTVIQAAAVSGDPITNGLSFLVVALTLRAALQNSPVRRTQWLGLLLGFVGLGLAKPAYITLLGLLVAIPLCNQHARNRKAWLGWLATAATGGIAAMLWQHAVSWIPPMNQTLDKVQTQYSFMRENPLSTLTTLIRTFLTTHSGFGGGGYIFRELFGSAAWLRISIAEPFAIALSGAMLASPFIREPEESSWIGTRRVRVILSGGLILLALIGSVLLAVGLYAVWSDPQSLTVTGLQGRYFIPLVPLVLFAVMPWCAGAADFQRRLKTLVMGALIFGQIAMVCEVWLPIW